MAVNVYGYGLYFYDHEDFVQQNQELINTIRKESKHQNLEDKIIVGIGGGNCDLSYFFGIYIQSVEYGSVTLSEIQDIFSQQDYRTLFNERLAKHPVLEQVLKDYLHLVNSQIILDLE